MKGNLKKRTHDKKEHVYVYRVTITVTVSLFLMFLLLSRGGNDGKSTKKSFGHLVESKESRLRGNTHRDVKAHPPTSELFSIFPDADMKSESFHQGEESVSQPPAKHRPVVISGPSGVGKGTLISMLMKFYAGIEGAKSTNEDLFGFSVSHTTRGPRPGEFDGVHYHFSTVRNAMEIE